MLHPTSQSITTTRGHTFNLHCPPSSPLELRGRRKPRGKNVSYDRISSLQPLKSQQTLRGRQRLSSSAVKAPFQSNFPLPVKLAEDVFVNRTRHALGQSYTRVPVLRNVNGEAQTGCRPGLHWRSQPQATWEALSSAPSHYTSGAIIRTPGHLRKGSGSQACLNYFPLHSIQQSV